MFPDDLRINGEGVLYRNFVKSDILGDCLMSLEKSFASVRIFFFPQPFHDKNSKSVCQIFQIHWWLDNDDNQEW